jgi:hypothetical protein
MDGQEQERKKIRASQCGIQANELDEESISKPMGEKP